MKQGIFRHHKAQTQRKPILQLLVFTNFTVQWGINFKMSSLRPKTNWHQSQFYEFIRISFPTAFILRWMGMGERKPTSWFPYKFHLKKRQVKFMICSSNWPIPLVPLALSRWHHWLTMSQGEIAWGGAPGWGVRDFHQTVIRITVNDASVIGELLLTGLISYLISIPVKVLLMWRKIRWNLVTARLSRSDLTALQICFHIHILGKQSQRWHTRVSDLQIQF